MTARGGEGWTGVGEGGREGGGAGSSEIDANDLS